MNIQSLADVEELLKVATPEERTRLERIKRELENMKAMHEARTEKRVRDVFITNSNAAHRAGSEG